MGLPCTRWMRKTTAQTGTARSFLASFLSSFRRSSFHLWAYSCVMRGNYPPSKRHFLEIRWRRLQGLSCLSRAALSKYRKGASFPCFCARRQERWGLCAISMRSTTCPFRMRPCLISFPPSSRWFFQSLLLRNGQHSWIGCLWVYYFKNIVSLF